MIAAPLLLLSGQTTSSGPPTLAYVAALDEESVTLVWGTPDNIGRSAVPGASVVVRVGEKQLETDAGWQRITGLAPDQDYEYSLSSGGVEFARGSVRTWPLKADSLAFFVIGDWGNGSSDQRRVAETMETERQRLEAAGTHVRFVLSTGDNLYGFWGLFGTGDSDKDWDRKFFRPYRETLRSIPFYAVLGNHDGNESDRRDDLSQYLDNFFFPGGTPARWYRFQFADLAEFFALDSSRNTERGDPEPAYLEGGDQSEWLRRSLEAPGPPWRIAYFHHPMFTAGPEHAPYLDELRHWFDLFGEHGVQAVFAGHEHNFQYAARDARTRGIQFVVSGAGGQLRGNDIRSHMDAGMIAGWAPQRHFTSVEVTRSEIRITPVSYEPVKVVGPDGRQIEMPLRVPLP